MPRLRRLCDARDFWQFWDARASCDVVLGWRVTRPHTVIRRAFSRFFYLLYRVVPGVPMHDPSCPYVLIPRAVAARLVDQLGAMQQGFWLYPRLVRIAAATVFWNCR